MDVVSWGSFAIRLIIMSNYTQQLNIIMRR
jgi:hypothetical protein